MSLNNFTFKDEYTTFGANNIFHMQWTQHKEINAGLLNFLEAKKPTGSGKWITILSESAEVSFFSNLQKFLHDYLYLSEVSTATTKFKLQLTKNSWNSNPYDFNFDISTKLASVDLCCLYFLNLPDTEFDVRFFAQPHRSRKNWSDHRSSMRPGDDYINIKPVVGSFLIFPAHMTFNMDYLTHTDTSVVCVGCKIERTTV